jgi:hypothetical protein
MYVSTLMGEPKFFGGILDHWFISNSDGLPCLNGRHFSNPERWAITELVLKIDLVHCVAETERHFYLLREYDDSFANKTKHYKIICQFRPGK